MRKRRRWLLLGAFLLIYISSYYVLSRRGFATADEYGMKGFYFFIPRDTDTWRRVNYGCVCLYYPLIQIDLLLGVGRPVAKEPLWGLSR